jgi:PHD/YefM family antitoxin component YafN of YafNO toxin-antitoxin module
MIISANELKTKGLAFIEKSLNANDEVFVSFRGKTKFVMLTITEYERLKEADLETSIHEAEEDYKNKKYIVESAEEHFKRIGI